jgi:glutathione peroxidase-family protein
MLGPESYVIEVASNDGYLLRNFLEAGIPCLGIEPTTSTARAAEAIGIPTLQEFFSETLARQLSVSGRKADLIVVNNVYAHVPDINGFTKGLSLLLKPEGVVTLEFPHLLELIRQTQFDTVYHEHFSYLSLSVVQKIFSEAGLRVWDVERLSTHGGSLRVFGCHKNSVKLSSKRVIEVLEQERSDALNGLATYTNFQAQADRIKDNFLAFLIEQKRAGKSVAGYGAAAKANTLLNYAGIKPDLLPYVCDAALSKQGRFLPGSHIPIYSPRRLEDSPPDIVLVFPWNLRDELSAVLAPVVAAGSEIYVAVPQLERIA